MTEEEVLEIRQAFEHDVECIAKKIIDTVGWDEPTYEYREAVELIKAILKYNIEEFMED